AAAHPQTGARLRPDQQNTSADGAARSGPEGRGADRSVVRRHRQAHFPGHAEPDRRAAGDAAAEPDASSEGSAGPAHGRTAVTRRQGERFLVGRRGEPQAIMSVTDYIDTFVPTPAWLKAIGAEAKRKGLKKLTMRAAI